MISSACDAKSTFQMRQAALCHSFAMSMSRLHTVRYSRQILLLCTFSTESWGIFFLSWTPMQCDVLFLVRICSHRSPWQKCVTDSSSLSLTVIFRRLCLELAWLWSLNQYKQQMKTFLNGFTLWTSISSNKTARTETYLTYSEVWTPWLKECRKYRYAAAAACSQLDKTEDKMKEFIAILLSLANNLFAGCPQYGLKQGQNNDGWSFTYTEAEKMTLGR